MNRTRRASTPVTDRLEMRVTTKPTTTMNDSQHNTRIGSQEQRRQAAERRRLHAFTAPEAWGGAGLSEAQRLITTLETQHTE